MLHCYKQTVTIQAHSKQTGLYTTDESDLNLPGLRESNRKIRAQSVDKIGIESSETRVKCSVVESAWSNPDNGLKFKLTHFHDLNNISQWVNTKHAGSFKNGCRDPVSCIWI